MRKEEIHFFQQDKVYFSQRQGIRSPRSWCCSNPILFSLPFLSSLQSSHQKPGPQTPNGSWAPAEQTTNGVIFSCRVNPHYQHTAQKKNTTKILILMSPSFCSKLNLATANPPHAGSPTSPNNFKTKQTGKYNRNDWFLTKNSYLICRAPTKSL